MTFLDSQVARALYDVHDGGKPRGYECKMVETQGYANRRSCARVTRTWRGMVAHLRIVHRFKFQGEFDFASCKPLIIQPHKNGLDKENSNT